MTTIQSVHVLSIHGGTSNQETGTEVLLSWRCDTEDNRYVLETEEEFALPKEASMAKKSSSRHISIEIGKFFTKQIV